MTKEPRGGGGEGNDTTSNVALPAVAAAEDPEILSGAPSLATAAAVFLAAFSASVLVVTFLSLAGFKPSGDGRLGFISIASQLAFSLTLAGGVLLWGKRRSAFGAIRLSKKLGPVAILKWAALGVLLQFAILATLYGVGRVFTGFDPSRASGPIEHQLASSSAPVKVALVLISVLAAPLSEELFFRGMLLAAAERHFGRWTAVAMTSVLFGLAHFNLYSILPLALVGAVFASIDIRSESLWPSIAAHTAFNALAVVGLLLPSGS